MLHEHRIPSARCRASDMHLGGAIWLVEPEGWGLSAIAEISARFYWFPPPRTTRFRKQRPYPKAWPKHHQQGTRTGLRAALDQWDDANNAMCELLHVKGGWH